MTNPAGPRDVGPSQRVAAFAAILLAFATVVIIAVYLFRNPAVLLYVVVAEVVIVPGLWITVTNRGVWRWTALALSVAAAIAVTVLLVANHFVLQVLVPVVLLDLLSTAAAGYALGSGRRSSAAEELKGAPAAPPQKAVFFMNRKSGGGKVDKFGLDDIARGQGAEVVYFGPGVERDLVDLVNEAVAGGADCLGAAGGDGSQAIVAQVASEHDLAFVCIPAGTRNHLALDLGLDREDPRRAFGALSDGVETRVDLATVADRSAERVFVNNVSLGIYAKVVQEGGYRDDKLGTFAGRVPDLIGPTAEPFDLQCRLADGSDFDGAQLVLVSNNPYQFESLTAFGTRERLDGGALGVVVARIDDASGAQKLVRLSAAGLVENYPGWNHWAPAEFTVTSRSGSVEAGVDGEAMTLESPLTFRSRPGALRILLPRDRPGRPSPRRRFRWRSVNRLFRLAFRGDTGPI